MSEQLPRFNAMQTVKRHFFAMRNGVVADVLRKAGSPFRFIFGVNLPQLSDIAAQTGMNPDLAEDLWANTATRESMLLAPMLQCPETFSREDAVRWIQTVPAAEVADVLCLKLLRKQPYALDLVEELADRADRGQGDADMQRYIALRLMFNLVSADPDMALRIGRRIAGHRSALTDSVATSLVQEAEFLLES